MGAKHHVFSPTQIDMWLGCRRKWAFRYIAHIETPQAGSAALGSDTHGQLEDYLKEGIQIDFTRPSGYVAKSGLHLLPEPKTPGMLIEQPFSFESKRYGFGYRGLIDVLLDDSSKMPDLEVCTCGILMSEHNADYTCGSPEHDQRVVPCVSDHKTCGNLQYMKKAEDLRYDSQATIYAFHGMATFLNPIVDLVWTYLPTKSGKMAKGRRTHLRVHSEHVSKVFHEIELLAKEMADAHDNGIEPNELEPNLSQCTAYGGCPYWHVCKLTNEQKIKRMNMSVSKDSGTMSIVERMRARAAQASGGSIAEPPKVEGVTYSKAFLEAPTEAPPPMPEEETPPAINPPEYQPPPRVAEDIPEEAVTSAEIPKAKRGPGRPKKDAAQTELAAPRVERTEAAALPSNGFTLYVDCLPQGRVIRAAEELINEAKKIVCAEFKTDDYRFGPGEYGKGAGALSVTVGRIMDQSFPVFDMSLSTSTPEGQACLVELSSRASLVVRGLR